MSNSQNKSASLQDAVLLVQCPDEKGLIHRITGQLLDANANIVANGEFVDRETQTFFMRAEFSGAGDLEALSESVRDCLPDGAQVDVRLRSRKSCVLLATREPHCLGDLLLRHASGDLPCEIQAVVSQYEDLGSLVRRFDIPFHFIPVNGDDRAVHERDLLATVQKYDPEYVVLAKYMRILSPEFVAHFPNRMINIHHSFLPAFIGARPYEQAYRRGVKIIGATAHFVTTDLDQGPILTQEVLSVDHSHGPEEMAQSGRDVERTCLARALRLVFEDRVLVHGNRTIVFS